MIFGNKQATKSKTVNAVKEEKDYYGIVCTMPMRRHEWVVVRFVRKICPQIEIDQGEYRMYIRSKCTL